MPNITESKLLSFRDELRKIAFSPAVAARLTSTGALGGIGAGLGAVYGGLDNMHRGYEESRQSGQSFVRSLAQGAFSGLGGAVRGGAVGALGGAAAGAALPSLGTAAAKAFSGRGGAIGALTRAGQRQVHGLTGHGDLEALRGGAYDAKKTLEVLRNKAVSASPEEKAKILKEIASAEKTVSSMGEANRMGLTSIPGVVKSLRRNGLVNTLGTNLKAQWAGSPTWMKGLMGASVGLNALDIARSTESKDPERVGHSIGNSVGSLAISPMMPFGAGILTQEALSRGGRMLGRGVGRLRRPSGEIGVKPEDSAGQTSPSEVVKTPAAEGRIPDEMVGV